MSFTGVSGFTSKFVFVWETSMLSFKSVSKISAKLGFSLGEQIR